MHALELFLIPSSSVVFFGYRLTNRLLTCFFWQAWVVANVWNLPSINCKNTTEAFSAKTFHPKNIRLYLPSPSFSSWCFRLNITLAELKLHVSTRASFSLFFVNSFTHLFLFRFLLIFLTKLSFVCNFICENCSPIFFSNSDFRLRKLGPS